MNNNLQISEPNTELMNDYNIKNASALLALIHGKSDSICRLFNREIIIDKSDLKTLNDMMINKLCLHNTSAVTTYIDITFSNKKVFSFKSWSEFESYNFSSINATTKSIFMQWDFLASINNYKIPQRHTVSVRISSSPNPSDFFKVLLSGGFDETHDIDIQSSTMICKVDFVNNTLAEELVNIAEHWNEICESPIKQKGCVRNFLSKHVNLLSHISEFFITLTLILLIAIPTKLAIINNLITITNEFVIYMLLVSLPIYIPIKNIANFGAKKTYFFFNRLMDTHIFKISKGDDKENQRIENASKFSKELTAFIINAIFSILLSLLFFILE